MTPHFADAASKHALHGYFDSLRVELSSHGVKVTTVCPGYVATNLSLHALRGDGTPHGVMDPATAAGVGPSVVAERVARAIAEGESEVVVADLKAKAAILLRALAPRLLQWYFVRKITKTNKSN